MYIYMDIYVCNICMDIYIYKEHIRKWCQLFFFPESKGGLRKSGVICNQKERGNASTYNNMYINTYMYVHDYIYDYIYTHI